MYGLLGETLKHSFSPQIHAMLGDYPYRLFEVAPRDLHAFLLKADFDGVNVTIPYKKAVIPYCDALSERAKRIGSVNTLLRMEDGTLTGHNTDYDGFEALLNALAFNPAGQKALILGSGGSAATIRTVLADKRATAVVVSRTGKDNYDNLSLHKDAALLVNTTPVGMYPGNGVSPVALEHFPNLAAVIDIVYNPARTKLLLDAQERGIPCIGGLLMLVAQAKAAAELFTGQPIQNGLIQAITERIGRQTKNVVLIGMPSSGKTTVGKALAAQTGRVFFDMDAIIEQRAGRSIPEIIGQDGEAAFRAMETEVLRDLSRESGAVIATGGGVVTVPKNLPLIRQNSVCVFLKRDLAKLSVKGRPLSQRYGVDALYQARLPLYQAWSDAEADCNKTVEQTVKEIREALHL